MNAPIPVKDLVLIGGGHAHVHVVKMLGMNPIAHLRISLISRDIESPYSGMIPGYIAGYYTHEECHIDICRLAGFANARFIHAEVYHIDVKERMIYSTDNQSRQQRPPIHYDLLSIDIGIIPKPLPSLITQQMALIDLSITPVKPIDRFAWKWEQILIRFRHISSSSSSSSPSNSPVFRLVVVGGGAGGTELSFAINNRLKNHLKSIAVASDLVQVTLLSKGATIMDKHAKLVSKQVEKTLAEKGILYYLKTTIINTETDKQTQTKYLISDDGRKFPFEEAIWCTEAMGQPWLKSTGLALDEDNCILVQPTLESINIAGVFAAGDICHNIKYPRPKAGVFAVRAGPPLLVNIKHVLYKEPLEEWIPQDEFLGLIGTGNEHAIASKGGMALEGNYLWTLKDKIDRQWMRGYQELPTMEEMESKKKQQQLSQPLEFKPIAELQEPDILQLLQKSKMRCAGCGSKVGSSVITRAFRRLQFIEKHSKETLAALRPEVIAGIGDDAAIMRIVDPAKYLVQTIDYFRSFVSDPYLFGQVAANHALSDVFAMNGEAVTALALCVLPYGTEQMVEDDLVQMLAGIKAVLTRERCALVGGHTSEGSEQALGLAVTGMVNPSKIFHKGPILHRLGYHIILTKPIGTGTILAAQMRNQAKGRWVQQCYEMMLQSNSLAASILEEFSCIACTDVTGFALLGHLVEMIRYERVLEEENVQPGLHNHTDLRDRAVRLNLSKIPVLAGAKECCQLGILSTLFSQNVRSQQFIENVYDYQNHPVYRLLFDPQTSGGLLAVVPPNESEELMQKLRNAGYKEASVIGEITTSRRGTESEGELEAEEFYQCIHLT